MNGPLHSLEQGTWFKLICGASFHHLPSIQNLALIYTLAGADCIDVAADPAIVRAARVGIEQARQWDQSCTIPWLMASFNDGVDPHFRKATLPQASCPQSCSQPCLAVCPPHAISSLSQVTHHESSAVLIQPDLCYGCGRCEPVCPHQLIQLQGYQVSAATVLPDLLAAGVQAIEIHTQVGRLSAFAQLWHELKPWIPTLKVVSISFGDPTDPNVLGTYLWHLVDLMNPKPPTLIWQTDGRPMSGDIGPGTTKATLKLATQVLELGLPGYIQLAGGTNQATIPLLGSHLAVMGVAYGSYARQLVAAASELDLRHDPDQLAVAVAQARQLVQQVKQRRSLSLEPMPSG